MKPNLIRSSLPAWRSRARSLFWSCLRVLIPNVSRSHISLVEDQDFERFVGETALAADNLACVGCGRSMAIGEVVAVKKVGAVFEFFCGNCGGQTVE